MITKSVQFTLSNSPCSITPATKFLSELLRPFFEVHFSIAEFSCSRIEGASPSRNSDPASKLRLASTNCSLTLCNLSSRLKRRKNLETNWKSTRKVWTPDDFDLFAFGAVFPKSPSNGKNGASRKTKRTTQDCSESARRTLELSSNFQQTLEWWELHQPGAASWTLQRPRSLRTNKQETCYLYYFSSVMPLVSM